MLLQSCVAFGRNVPQRAFPLMLEPSPSQDVARRETRSVCCYCGVGCGVIIESEGAQITGVRGDPDHPANFGKLCSKGAALHLTAQPALKSSRLLHPEMRLDRDSPRQRVSWNEAIEQVGDRFADTIARHGPDSVAFYVSGQLLTEDYYVFNKLAKALAGTNNIDSNSRLCMSSAVAGYKQSLGADAPPCSYEDIEAAGCLFIAGSNTAYAHPIVYRRIEAARARRPDMRVVVVDPRRTETARDADLHLPILPGTDVALFHGMLHIMLWEGWVSQAYIDAHTEGFDALKATLREYTPRMVAEVCGIDAADLLLAAKWFAQSSATLSLYCQGLNQSTSGTAKNSALINLHLATGQIGKPGAGPFSLTGQPNAMGGREVGALANLLPAHRDLGNAGHRAEVARLWGVAALSPRPGKTAVEMFAALASGEIKAIWIACTNPAQSLPDQTVVRAALRQAEFVVLQEAYRNTETAWYADVLLPAATWGEKEGTVTNSERRITRVRAAVPALGEARADWAIATAIARRMQSHLLPNQTDLFPYASAEEVWMEHRATTIGSDIDIGGLSYAGMEERGPQQWPLPFGATAGKVRLYGDGVYPTASGKAQFAATAYKPVAEAADARYPMRLTTGRLRDQWHGMTRTGSVAQLFGHAPEPVIGMNPQDLVRRGLVAGELLHVESRRGALYVLAQADESLRAGQVFLPMHWGARFLGGSEVFGVNTLTLGKFDAISKQPELKHAAVRVSKAQLPWRLTAFGYPGHGSAIAMLDALAPVLNQFAYASAVLIGREHEGVLLRIAERSAASALLIETIDRLFGLAHANTLRYDDSARKTGRRADIVAGQLRAVRLSGDAGQLAAEAWLKEWMLAAEPVAEIRRFLLAPTASAPLGFKSLGNVVCTCWNVTDVAINAQLAELSGPDDARLQALRAALRCGTNCGSCEPALRIMVRDWVSGRAAA